MRPRWRFADRRPNDGPRYRVLDVIVLTDTTDVWARSLLVLPPPGVDVVLWPEAAAATAALPDLSYTATFNQPGQSGAALVQPPNSRPERAY